MRFQHRLAKEGSGVQILTRRWPAASRDLVAACPFWVQVAAISMSTHRGMRWNPPADKLVMLRLRKLHACRLQWPPDNPPSPNAGIEAKLFQVRKLASNSKHCQGGAGLAAGRRANGGGFQTLSNLPALSVRSVASVHSPSPATRRRSRPLGSPRRHRCRDNRKSLAAPGYRRLGLLCLPPRSHRFGLASLHRTISARNWRWPVC
jgi:hypothetical protein